MKLPKQAYTTEFKDQAVAQVASGRGIPTISQELGMSEQRLHNWVKAAKAGKLSGGGNTVVTPEQMELSRLRAEVMRLKRENEILKKATVYFAKDAL